MLQLLRCNVLGKLAKCCCFNTVAILTLPTTTKLTKPVKLNHCS